MAERRIEKLLIANRGEIASRIQRTCRSMGIETVAVYSDADADAAFVREADEAFRIGPAPSAESYLRADAILEAARVTGADAIHPGFGFLAENADFAQAVLDAELIFVGPSPDAIRSMGSKQRAKKIARDAGVPVIPGYDGDDQSLLEDEAKKIGLPVLVKASAGGGGKGMRVVREESELAAAIEGARREAEKSFGDGALLIEKYIERPRHVEIQIIGDEHGGLVHLYERECSIQRRHQKIIEEAPSPDLDPIQRQLMGGAALKLAATIGYTNAGTVEMILDEEGEFYFLEVNTRLQVEHPVTEAITDIDLVELQLRVARGEELPLDQTMVDTIVSGVAIECRLYAEDPDRDFLPQSGRILDWSAPTADWLRVDAGVESGSEVSIHYDPMLAKVIAWGVDRDEAIARMRWALRRLSVLGLTTNRDFLLRVLGHDAFRAAEIHTHFVDEHLSEPSGPEPELLARAAIAHALTACVTRERTLPSMRSGFRNNRLGPEEVRYAHGEDELIVRYRDLGRGRFAVGLGDADAEDVSFSFSSPTAVIVDARGLRSSLRLAREGMRCFALVGARTIALTEEPRFPEASAESAADGAIAPMPGQIVKVLVSEGDIVEAGQTLAIMEAMKMEHSIGAPHAGVVAELSISEGQQVDDGAVLAVIRAPEAEEPEGA